MLVSLLSSFSSYLPTCVHSYFAMYIYISLLTHFLCLHTNCITYIGDYIFMFICTYLPYCTLPFYIYRRMHLTTSVYGNCLLTMHQLLTNLAICISICILKYTLCSLVAFLVITCLHVLLDIMPTYVHIHIHCLS